MPRRVVAAQGRGGCGQEESHRRGRAGRITRAVAEGTEEDAWAARRRAGGRDCGSEAGLARVEDEVQVFVGNQRVERGDYESQIEVIEMFRFMFQPKDLCDGGSGCLVHLMHRHAALHPLHTTPGTAADCQAHRTGSYPPSRACCSRRSSVFPRSGGTVQEESAGEDSALARLWRTRRAGAIRHDIWTVSVVQSSWWTLLMPYQPRMVLCILLVAGRGTQGFEDGYQGQESGRCDAQ